jgi:hypothetical protein
LTPGSDIRDGKIQDPGTGINILVHISKSLVTISGFKFFVADPDPGSGIRCLLILDPGSVMEKFGSGISNRNPQHCQQAIYFIRVWGDPV